jgi:hypothetical protein
MKMSKAPVLCIEVYFLSKIRVTRYRWAIPVLQYMLDRITIGCSAGARRLSPKKVQQKFLKELIKLF